MINVINFILWSIVFIAWGVIIIIMIISSTKKIEKHGETNNPENP